MAHVVAVISDLIFKTKVDSTARSIGAEASVVASIEELRGVLSAKPVSLVVVDMQLPGEEATETIAAAAGHTPRPRIVAFHSHVQTELADAAKRAGADEVIPRSAFSSGLAAILQGAG